MADTSILALIASHTVALAANDAAHDAHENRKPGITSEELAPILTASDACFAAERAAWNALAITPCSSAADVQAKLAYILDSERLCDWIEGGIDDPLAFLRSLRLPTPPVDPFVDRMRRYHADVEAYNNSGRDDDVDPWHAFETELENGTVTIASAAGAAAALRQVVALDAVGCMESELWIAKTLAFLESASAKPAARSPDPLLGLITAYRAGLAIEHDVPDEEWDARREEVAASWRPVWDRLCSDPPAATSLMGVQAALQLVYDENATGVSVELTSNVTRAALAYFGRAS